MSFSVEEQGKAVLFLSPQNTAPWRLFRAQQGHEDFKGTCVPRIWKSRGADRTLPTAVLFLLITWAQLRAGTELHGGGYCCVCVLFSFWFLSGLSSPGVFLFTLLMSPMRSGFPLLTFVLNKEDLVV